MGRSNQEQTSERKGHKTSLSYSTGGEMKKVSLGLPLIPPICKAGSLPVDSAAGSLQSSLQLSLQKSREMRPRPSRRRQEKTSEDAASSESTTKTQRKKEKNSQLSGPGMPLFQGNSQTCSAWNGDMPGLGNGDLGSRLAQGALAQEPQEHGSASHRGLTGYCLTKKFCLVVSEVPLSTKSLPPV